MPVGCYQGDFSLNNHTLMEYYVYQHRAIDTNKIFYVGKGKGIRHADKNKRSRYWKFFVEKHGFYSEILKANLDEDFAFLIEKEAINIYKKRGIKLVNLTDGGEGCSGYSHLHTAESKAKMSASQIGNTNKNGKTLSAKSKEKISKAKLGKHLSIEHCKAISNGLIGNKHTAKLTDDEVRFVRTNKNIMTHIELGKMFGLHKNTIHKIWRFERYKDVI